LSKLKAVHLVGTLNPSPEVSNTYTLSEFLARYLDSYGIENDIVRLIDYSIKPGTYTHVIIMVIMMMIGLQSWKRF
jgi:hypothetical protein